MFPPKVEAHFSGGDPKLWGLIPISPESLDAYSIDGRVLRVRWEKGAYRFEGEPLLGLEGTPLPKLPEWREPDLVLQKWVVSDFETGSARLWSKSRKAPRTCEITAKTRAWGLGASITKNASSFVAQIFVGGEIFSDTYEGVDTEEIVRITSEKWERKAHEYALRRASAKVSYTVWKEGVKVQRPLGGMSRTLAEILSDDEYEGLDSGSLEAYTEEGTRLYPTSRLVWNQTIFLKTRNHI